MTETAINNTVKTFWVMFFKERETGSIYGKAFGHNCKADYKNDPYFIGCEMIEVDMDWLKP